MSSRKIVLCSLTAALTVACGPGYDIPSESLTPTFDGTGGDGESSQSSGGGASGLGGANGRGGIQSSGAGGATGIGAGGALSHDAGGGDQGGSGFAGRPPIDSGAGAADRADGGTGSGGGRNRDAGPSPNAGGGAGRGRGSGGGGGDRFADNDAGHSGGAGPGSAGGARDGGRSGQEDAATDCPANGNVTYTLQKEASPTAEQQSAYDKITAAMETAVSYYNCYTNITKALRISFVPTVATADGNTNGSIRFGSSASMNHITAMHEIAHTVGIGFGEFNKLVSNGVFTGTTATAQLRQITGKADDVLHADTQHFWPYGLNYTSEVKSTDDLVNHCKIVVAIRADMGM